MKKLGQRIAELRVKEGLTQEQLADAIEVHRTYIGFIEQGKRNAVIWNLYRISKVLKISLQELFSELEKIK
ncbi:MAG TPA: helix-turn-helix transcriptional regulator [Patescibacteria group bacterium]|nr:helix-turn-helix transcriptional regulator [Patescibacteria group bacterium]